VSLSKNCWICFGDCHRGGSIIDFVSRKEGLGIRDAGLLIQDWFGIAPGTATEQQVNGQAVVPPAQRIPHERTANHPLGFALSNLDPGLAVAHIFSQSIQFSLYVIS
jgi:DNA primase